MSTKPEAVLTGKIVEFIHSAFIPLVIVTNKMCPGCNREFLLFTVLDNCTDLRLHANRFTGYYNCPTVACDVENRSLIREVA